LKKQRKFLIFTISIILILAFSSVFAKTTSAADVTNQVKVARENATHYYDLQSTSISIIYDESVDLVNGTADSLNQSLSLLTPDVNTIKVDSVNQLYQAMGSATINIYIFESNAKSLHISSMYGSLNVSWANIADQLWTHQDVDHVFAMGNTHQLYNEINTTRIHGSNQELVDAKHMFVYTMWTLADILENKVTTSARNLGKDIRKATLQYFGTNINDLITRNIKPEDRLGVISEKTKNASRESFFAKHPASVERIQPEGTTLNDTTGRVVDATTGEVGNYTMDFISPDAVTPSDFLLQLLPTDSGLRGPIGGIVDALLKFLVDKFSSAIGIGQNVVDQIVQTLVKIPKLIGTIGDSASSSMKQFLKSAKNLLPIPEDQSDLFNFVVDALFSLRGDFTQIKDFLISGAKYLIPDLSIGGVNVLDMLSSVLDIGQEVAAKVSNGDNIISVVFSVLNEKILTNYTTSIISNVTSYLTGVDVNSVVSQVSGVISTVTNILTSGDISKLVADYGPTLLNALGIDPSIAEPIMQGINMLMTATGYVKGSTLTSVLTDLLSYFLPTTEIQTITNVASSVIKLVSDILDGKVTLQNFGNNLISILTSLPLADDAVNAIKMIMGLVLKARDTSLNLSNLDYTATISNFIDYIAQSIGGVVADKINVIKSTAGTILTLVNQFLNKDYSGLIQAAIGNTVSTIKDQLYNIVDFIFQSQLGQTLQAASQKASDILHTALGAIDIAFKTIGQFKDNAIQGVMTTLLQASSFIMGQIDGFQIPQTVKLVQSILGKVAGVIDDPPTLQEIIDLIIPFIPQSIVSEAKTVISFLFNIKDMFTNTFQALFGKLAEWISGKVKDVISTVSGPIGDALSQTNWQLLDIDLPIGIGSFSLFSIAMKLGLQPGLKFDAEALGKTLFDVVFNGASFLSGDMNAGAILKKCLSFFSIVPKLKASFKIDGFGSESQQFMKFLLDTLGLKLSFSGGGFFTMSLLSFKNGVFDTNNFMKILEWGFSFVIEVSKTFTVLDILTGGAGGGLSSLAKYIGLDALTLTIALSLAVDIVKRAATANRPETGSLTIAIGIAATVALSINIIIATLKLSGTLALTLTLLQDLVEPTPMRVFISIQLIFKALVDFSVWEWHAQFKWSPAGFEPPLGYEITPATPQAAADKGALGADFDGDGLGNKYEASMPGMNPKTNDTDGDGLSDKFETQTLGTDPANPDTDGDGLSDKVEFDMKTNPLKVDTDLDQLGDYKEVVQLGTNPLSTDSDQDGLSDFYEVNHSYNMTGITPTVDHVTIGNKTYTDHTDPLNKDTDGDGLLDGAEGPTGVYYGPNLANRTDGLPPLYFNNGYTSPLDADTDDDSYRQLVDGSIANVKDNFLMDLNDYQEVHGISVVFYNATTGEPMPPQLVRTNPVMPDSDSDTGETAQQRDNPPIDLTLNSDGYELSRNPPTDPNDADTDNDGLIDGYEGVLRPDSNHTSVNNPDTDGDGLGDLQEIQLGSDPRSKDTDRDGVTDGKEFFVFGTNLFNPDTDSDGLLDGEELYTFHSSPFLKDTDGDGLSDYNEVFVYHSKPADKDSDNDFLNDYQEVMIHYTNPSIADTDGDKLLDGEEVQGLQYQTPNGTITVYTDPLKWDTDNDSITTLDQNGQMSLPLSDYQEYKAGTRPDRPDTDQDGIRDSWEMWLGKGKIPWMDPINLNPLNSDTDGDGLRDSQEIRIANVTTLLYPYVGFVLDRPLNSSAVNPDTDGDGLSDLQEYNLGSDLNSTDTDGDTLPDAAEVNNYKTDPTLVDTDGDGLNDTVEIQGFAFPANSTGLSPNAVIYTNATNSDSDGDLLPDGYEVKVYNLDPRKQDSDNNGIVDGLDVDKDKDGLADGLEFYKYHTIESPYGGGPDVPDSDQDALYDGTEVQIGTNPTLYDTDNDTFSDGLEYFCHTDPLDNSTTADQFDNCLATQNSGVTILSPANTTYTDNQVNVVAYTTSEDVSSMQYRFKESGAASYSISRPMFDNNTDGQYQASEPLVLPQKNATYHLQVVTQFSSGNTSTSEVVFTVGQSRPKLQIISPTDITYEMTKKPAIPIEVEAGLAFNQVQYSLGVSNTSDVYSDQPLQYNSTRQTYYNQSVPLIANTGNTSYTLTITGTTVSDLVFVSQINFTVTYTPAPHGIFSDPLTVGAIAFVGGISATGVGILVYKRRFA